MFTWICPKCGKEVPPSYSECPNCAATAAAGPEPPRSEPARSDRTEQIRSEPVRTEPVAPAVVPPVPRAAAPVQKSGGLPGWAMALIFGLAFIAIGAGLITFFKSRSSADQPAQAAPPAATAAKAHPLLKNLEVTGLRLTEDPKQKAFLEFVVVNHSPADVPGLTANAKIVPLKADTDAEPLATFSFKTDLGPFQAKDLKVPVNTKLRAYELPDWQLIRADVEITAP